MLKDEAIQVGDKIVTLSGRWVIVATWGSDQAVSKKFRFPGTAARNFALLVAVLIEEHPDQPVKKLQHSVRNV